VLLGSLADPLGIRAIFVAAAAVAAVTVLVVAVSAQLKEGPAVLLLSA
jgi:hypothetical protein